VYFWIDKDTRDQRYPALVVSGGGTSAMDAQVKGLYWMAKLKLLGVSRQQECERRRGSRVGTTYRIELEGRLFGGGVMGICEFWIGYIEYM